MKKLYQTITDIFAEQRRGRSADDLGTRDFIKTVENRLHILCKNLANIIEARTFHNEDYTFPQIFSLMGDCFNLQYAYDTRTTEFGVDALKMLLKASCTDPETSDKVLAEYDIFKKRFLDLVKEDSLRMRNSQMFLYETHKCASDCVVGRDKDCPLQDTPAEPKKLVPVK